MLCKTVKFSFLKSSVLHQEKEIYKITVYITRKCNNITVAALSAISKIKLKLSIIMESRESLTGALHPTILW